MNEGSLTRLLLIEDNLDDAYLLRDILTQHGAHDIVITHVTCIREAEISMLQSMEHIA